MSIGQGIVIGARLQAASRLFSTTTTQRFAATPLSSHSTLVKQSSSRLLMCQTSRNLYSEPALGMEKLDRMRERRGQLFSDTDKERYLERLRKYIEDNDAKSVFKDDLLNLMAIAENEQHLDLLEKIVTSNAIDQDTFLQGWGTTLMRLYYKMNQLDRAYNNLKDVERFGEFFNQRSCYKIAMTMLFNAGRFRDVVEIYHLADRRLADGTDAGGARYLSTLAFGALAKINNEEAMKEAENLYSRIKHLPHEKGASRSVQFLAYLAVNNNKPKYALNLISQTPSKHYITMKELKISSLIKLERYEDILFQLREYAKSVKRDRNLLLKSTFDIIEKSLNMVQDASMRQEISDILVEIKSGGHVSDATIEELLFKEINEFTRPPVSLDNSFGQRKFDNENDFRPRHKGDNSRQQDRLYNATNQQPRTGKKRFTYQNLDLSN